jgi:HlyD family secretion protein
MKAIKITFLIILLFILGFIIYRSVSSKSQQVPYTTTFAQMRDIIETINISGNVFPIKEIEVKSQLSGILEEIFVRIGDNVKEGTAIAAVKLVPSTSDIEHFESVVAQAKIEFSTRCSEYLRDKTLFESRVISQSEMDEAKRIYLIAKENLTSAQNQLDILKKGRVRSKNISNIIKASTAGTIIDIPFEVGSSVIERSNYSAGTTVAVVAEMKRFKFKALLSEQYIRYVRLNDNVSIRFNAYPNLQTQAVITKIASKGELENGIVKYMLDAEFEIKDTMPILRSGYSATATITLNSNINTLSIEEKYIDYENDSSFVYVLDTINKIAIHKRIEIGISDGIYTEIKGNIGGKEQIITNYDKVKSNP